MVIKREIRHRTFIEQKLEIDGRHFQSCSFAHCVFVFAGRDVPIFDEHCEFRDVRFELADGAERMVLLLQQLRATGFGPLAETLIDATPQTGQSRDA